MFRVLITRPRGGWTIPVLLTAALCFAGCNEPRSHVELTSPTGDAVPATQSVIEVRFDRPMRETSIDTSTFTVVGSESGLHTGEFDFPSEKSVRFHVNEQFTEGEIVTVSLSDEIESRAGKKLRAHSFSFKIEGDDTVPPVGEGTFEVIGTSPETGLIANDAAGDIDVQLSERFNPFTVGQSSVHVTGSRSGARLLEFNDLFSSGLVLSMSVDRAFVAGEEVHVALSEALGSLEGQSLVATLRSFAIGTGGSTWPASALIQDVAAGEPVHVELLDVDGDGREEWYVARRDGVIEVFELEDDVVARAQIGALPAGVLDTAVADVDGDGHGDLVCLSTSGTQLFVVLGQTDLTSVLDNPQTVDLGAYVATAVGTGHVDVDGFPDVLVIGDGRPAAVLWGRADQLPGPITSLGVEAASIPATGDHDGDGLPDLAYALSSGSVAVDWGQGARSFTPGVVLDPPGGASAVYAFSSDLDAFADLLVVPTLDGFGSPASAISTVLVADGNRGFQQTDLPSSATTPGVAIADWDGDGRFDLLAPHDNAGVVQVFPGKGNGSFETATSHASTMGVQSVVVGDIDGDGTLDVAQVTGDRGWEIGLGAGGGPVVEPEDPPANVFRMADVTATVGETGVAYEASADHDVDMQGFTLIFSYDVSVISIDTITTDGTDAGLVGAEFAAPLIDASAGVARMAIIFDMLPPIDGRVLAAGLDNSLVRGELSVLPGAAVGGSELTLENDLGSPPTDNIITDNGVTVRPELESGWITIGEAAEAPQFLRGDTNLDSIVDLADALSIDAYLFHGGTEPLCADAADANDDGVVDLDDSLYLKDFIFANGPAPSSPYPTPGTDPTSDNLDCSAAP